MLLFSTANPKHYRGSVFLAHSLINATLILHTHTSATHSSVCWENEWLRRWFYRSLHRSKSEVRRSYTPCASTSIHLTIQKPPKFQVWWKHIFRTDELLKLSKHIRVLARLMCSEHAVSIHQTVVQIRMICNPPCFHLQGSQRLPGRWRQVIWYRVETKIVTC